MIPSDRCEAVDRLEVGTGNALWDRAVDRRRTAAGRRPMTSATPSRGPGKRALRLIPVGALALGWFCGPAGWPSSAAAASAATAAESDQTRTAAPTAPAGPPATIDGFRDAHFGMNEEQVKHAIRKDFPGQAAKLKSENQPTEKTTVLSLSVPDLLPGSGAAQVSYILGYKSKKLIQINVIWRSEGTEQSDETVVGTANSLRDYFADQSYKPGSEIANRQLGDNAIVVFRGADAQDRMVMVILNGAAAAKRKDEKPPRTPALTLEVSYIADPAHPDVYRIPKGEF
jgi:hypothetical protein